MEVLNSNSEFAHVLRTVLTQSVVQKLADVGSTNAVDKYTTLLSACAADNVVNEMEKKLLREYASSHKINEDMHNKCLGHIGWTPDEFHKGMKKTVHQYVQGVHAGEAAGAGGKEQQPQADATGPEFWAQKALAQRVGATKT